MSLSPSHANCRWNSMLVSLRRMVHESAWSAIMTVLAQARIEASDAASTPPLIMVKREQIIDILGHLEPFGEALQVRGSPGVVPCLQHLIVTSMKTSAEMREPLCRPVCAFILRKHHYVFT